MNERKGLLSLGEESKKGGKVTIGAPLVYSTLSWMPLISLVLFKLVDIITIMYRSLKG